MQITSMDIGLNCITMGTHDRAKEAHEGSEFHVQAIHYLQAILHTQHQKAPTQSHSI
jgi:hypothetical protein